MFRQEDRAGREAKNQRRKTSARDAHVSEELLQSRRSRVFERHVLDKGDTFSGRVVALQMAYLLSIERFWSTNQFTRHVKLFHFGCHLCLNPFLFAFISLISFLLFQTISVSAVFSFFERATHKMYIFPTNFKYTDFQIVLIFQKKKLAYLIQTKTSFNFNKLN